MVALVMACGCATSPVDPAAKAAFLAEMGDTTITVFPAFVRSGEGSYENNAASGIGDFLANEQLADVTISQEQVPVTGSWGSNQATMFRESAADLGAYVKEHSMDTRYALLPEYLIGGQGIPVGIHCYVVDANGKLVFGVLLNSHWSVFTDADPQTIEDCTEVLVEALRPELLSEDRGEQPAGLRGP